MSLVSSGWKLLPGGLSWMHKPLSLFGRKSARLWPRAYREQDTELLDRLLDDSFQMIDSEGKRSNKKEGNWRAVASHVSGYREHTQQD